jgi:hypothetical protein
VLFPYLFHLRKSFQSPDIHVLSSEPIYQ